MLKLYQIRHFSNGKKLHSSQFKNFFKLRIEDRPLSLANKFKEILRSNKQVKVAFHRLKYIFAISFLFFFMPGNQIPGQYYAKLGIIQVRQRLQVKKGDSEKSRIGQEIRFYDWKYNYLKRNGMLNSDLLSKDITSLCKMIDNEDEEDRGDNFAINECLAYMSRTILPDISKNNTILF